MPVHAIPTSSGDALHWYERSGCVAYRGRLYFTVDIGQYTCAALLRARVRGELSGGEMLFDEPGDAWRRDRWPGPDFSVGLQLTSPDRLVPDYRTCCFFMCERVVRRFVSFVDQINPAFKRLQRWFRAVVWRKRAEQRLQFALATHAWLADDAMRAIGVFIK